MNSRLRATAVALVLIMVLDAQGAIRPGTAVTSTPSPALWWNDSYPFRQVISVTNGGTTPMVNQTVILHLNFTGNTVEEPLATLRLVDSSGIEVPSVVVGAESAGLFTRSAYLLFMANIPQQSSSNFYVYHGAAFKEVPSYRSFGPTESMASGFLTAKPVRASADSSQLDLGFGTVDTESTMTKVSYESGVHKDFGPSPISSQPFSNDTGFASAGQLSPSAAVAYESVQAGSLQLTRILVLSSDGAVTIDAIANLDKAQASNVSLTSVVGLDGLNTLGSSRSFYDPSRGLLYTANPEGYFLMQQSSGASSFAVGDAAAVTLEASRAAFSRALSYAPASAAGFTWNLGTIRPNDSAWISSAWSVTADLVRQGSSLRLPIGASLGGEEVLGVATPNARSVWSASATLTNVVIPSAGLVIPFGIGNGGLIPASSSVNGTYIYSVPPSGQQDPKSWSASSSTTGNATAFASPQYYDFGEKTHFERLSILVSNPGTTARASLTSAGAFFSGGRNVILQVRYKASFGVSTGNLSAQRFFISADVDPSATGNYNESIFFPLLGSSPSLSATGCTSPGTPGFEAGTPLLTGNLVGDDSWRTASMRLPSGITLNGFNVKLRLCMATSSGFTGSMNLEMGAAGVVLGGQVSDIVGVSWSHSSPVLALDYLTQAKLLTPSGLTANLTITLLFQVDSRVSWADGSTFAGTITPPVRFSLNNSLLLQTATLGQPRLLGVLVGSSVSEFANSGEIGGTTGFVSARPGEAFVTPALPTNIQTETPFAVGLKSEPVEVSVLDRNQAGVPGVQVVPSANGVAIPVMVVTNGSGVAQFLVVPWSYNFVATYQGIRVGSADVQAGAQTSATIQADLYKVSLIVMDNRGGTLPDAQVTLSIGNQTLSGFTNYQGRYSFDGVANSIYQLTVVVGNLSVFSGGVSATANNVAISVTTTYLPPYTQLLVVIFLSVASVSIVVAFYFARRVRT